MTIIAYVYDAAATCIDCTKARFDDGYFETPDSDLANEILVDDHGFPITMHGREGNQVHPLMDIDNDFNDDGLNCDVCHEVIVPRR